MTVRAILDTKGHHILSVEPDAKMSAAIRLLAERKITPSMSRKGNCYDNAPMESFFKTFKTEEAYQTQYQTHQDVVLGTTNYIERFYNSNRLHSALGYRSPIDFERASSSCEICATA